MKNNILKSEDVYAFASSLAVFLQAGIPLQEGFSILKEETQAKDKVLYASLNDAMEHGASLHEAMTASRVFPTYAIKMCEVGEATGHLDQVMLSLSQYYKREYNLREQLKTAITYPAVLLIIMFVVVGVLVFKILPIFQSVLQSFGNKLNDFPYFFMQFGKIIAQVGFIVVLIFLIGVLLLWLKQRNQQHEFGFAYVIAHTFFSKKLYFDISMAQITYVLSLFLGSGADSALAFEYLSQMTLHPLVSDRLMKAKNDISNGDHFVKAIRHAQLYQGMDASMLEVGFRSGMQDQVFKQLSERYEDKVENSIASFLDILEPTIVAVLSVLVGMVLLSVMLPLMSIMSAVG